MKLETARFCLRPLTAADDTAAFRRWMADTAIVHPMNLPPRDLSPAQVAQYWASRDNRHNFFFGIFSRDGKAAGFYEVEYEPLHAKASFTIGIDAGFRRQAIVEETATALFDWLFGPMATQKIVALTLPANQGFRAIMRDGGFIEEAVLKDEVRSLIGEGRLDQIRIGLTPAQWKSGRQNFQKNISRKAAAHAADISTQKDRDHASQSSAR